MGLQQAGLWRVGLHMYKDSMQPCKLSGSRQTMDRKLLHSLHVSRTTYVPLNTGLLTTNTYIDTRVSLNTCTYVPLNKFI